MGRQPQPEIRAGLLRRCTDHALEHGLPDRLDPLAEASGVSTRMLLYHFGSRDDLLREILRQARSRQIAAWSDLLRSRPDVPYPVVLAHAWAAMSGPDGAPYVRMFSQLRENAEQRLWPGFRAIATTDWLGPLEDGLRSIGRPELATLVLAVIRGLLLDLEATADGDRADRAFHQFLAMFQ